MDIQKLTKDQAVVISGFTGILCGEFSDFHTDVEKRLGRGVQTFEFGSKEFAAEVKKLYEADFIGMGTVDKEQAKAQAVPEGYVLVKKVHPDAIVHNQGLGLFKECQVIYGWDGKSKDFKEALNKGFYHGVKLGAKAVLETAMIEAQEPAND